MVDADVKKMASFGKMIAQVKIKKHYIILLLGEMTSHQRQGLQSEFNFEAPKNNSVENEINKDMQSNS